MAHPYEIDQYLEQTEQKSGVKFIYAAEGGSRLFGWHRPTSDHDIKAIFVRPLDSYLGLTTYPETFEANHVSGSISIHAWDIRKAMALTAKSNPSMYELFNQAPLLDLTGLNEQITRLIPDFNTGALAKAYRAIVLKVLQDFMVSSGEKEEAKITVYMLRPLILSALVQRVPLLDIPQDLERLMALAMTKTPWLKRVFYDKLMAAVSSYVETGKADREALDLVVEQARQVTINPPEDNPCPSAPSRLRLNRITTDIIRKFG